MWNVPIASSQCPLCCTLEAENQVLSILKPHDFGESLHFIGRFFCIEFNFKHLTNSIFVLLLPRFFSFKMHLCRVRRRFGFVLFSICYFTTFLKPTTSLMHWIALIIFSFSSIFYFLTFPMSEYIAQLASLTHLKWN